MKKNLTEIVFILDRSGSMARLEDDTTGNIHKYAREEDRPEKALFVITADGMENASRQYTCDRINMMIQRQKEKYACLQQGGT